MPTRDLGARLAIASLVLTAACTPAASEGWFSLGFMNTRPDRGPVQVLAYFTRPALGKDGMNDDVLGCMSLEENRVATARRLIKASEGSLVAAGELTVTPRGGSPLVLRPPSKPGAYGAVWEPFFVPDQPIDVRFGGDDAPVFTGTIVAPPAVVLTEPPCRAGEPRCPPFDRSKDLVVRWIPVGHGFVRIDVVNPSDTILSSHCTFDARPGVGVIPRAIVPPTGDVRLWIHTFEATAIRGANGSILHLRVDAPSSEWTFPER